MNKKPEITGGMVVAAEPFTRICEKVNSFHAKRNEMMLPTMTPVFDMGIMIRIKVPILENPSILANLSTFGSPLK